jgi:hypothetical protein
LEKPAYAGYEMSRAGLWHSKRNFLPLLSPEIPKIMIYHHLPVFSIYRHFHNFLMTWHWQNRHMPVIALAVPVSGMVGAISCFFINRRSQDNDILSSSGVLSIPAFS